MRNSHSNLLNNNVVGIVNFNLIFPFYLIFLSSCTLVLVLLELKIIKVLCDVLMPEVCQSSIPCVCQCVCIVQCASVSVYVCIQYSVCVCVCVCVGEDR